MRNAEIVTGTLIDDGLAEAGYRPAGVADATGERFPLDAHLQRDAVVVHRCVIRVLHAQFDQHAHFESLARQRLDARNRDLERVLALHRSATGDRHGRNERKSYAWQESHGELRDG
jgi:hypothetical protein